MNKHWTILLISAATDAVINAGTAVGAAMVAKGDAMLPTMPVLVLAGIGALVSFARTVQQGLKGQVIQAAKEIAEEAE